MHSFIRNVGIVVLFTTIQLATNNNANLLDTDSQTKNTTSSREEKFFSLFSIVRFPNSACTGSNSLNGTCLTSSECTGYGGSGSGTCASGFGVCCIITIQTCGSTTVLNNTYWQNPGYGTAYTSAGQCSLFVKAISSDIDQIRLDFDVFTLTAPDTTVASTTLGQCLIDSFTVSGATYPVPAICGNNTNQHIYISYPPGSDLVTLNVVTTGTTASRFWNIRVQQIPTDRDYTAPDNCLQWYTDSSGTLKSFNFLSAGTPVVQHLAYQDYTICIRTNQGFCGISYSICSSGYPSFGISSAAPSGSPVAATAATTALLDQVCAYDWIQIPCASDQMNSAVLSSGSTAGCVTKICGIALNVAAAAPNIAVYSYRRPFELRFYTDSNELITTAASTESFGFCLKYAQQPCLSVATSG